MKFISYKEKAKIVVVSRRNPQKCIVFRCHYVRCFDGYLPYLSYRQDLILRQKISDPVVSRYSSSSLVTLPSYVEAITDSLAWHRRLIQVQ